MAKNENVVGASFAFDIAELQKGLKEAKQSISLTTSEFKKSTAGMNNWQKKVTGLAAKVGELSDNLKSQDKIVKNTRKQYELTAKQYGENSDEAKKLLIQLNKEEATYKKLEKDLNSYSSRLDKLRNGIDDGKKSTINFDESMSDLSKTITSGAKKAIVGITSAIAGYVTSLVAVSESTQEYRTDLSKLESNAQSAGVSLDVTKKALKGLNAITGETDSNIEALSNLMMAGFKDNNLQSAVDTLSDAVIKFPDTLKVESLADSLQESIKQMEMGNNATGQYAELLERLGYNLEDVTKKTKKKKTLEEKQAYLLDLVNKKIGGTTKAYREQNSELMDAADAQFDLNDAMAELGEKAEPAISLVKKEVASLVKQLVEWIDANVDLEDVTEDIVDGIKKLATNVIPPLIKVVRTLFDIAVDFLPTIVGIGSAILTYNAYVKTATVVTKAYNVITTTLKAAQLLLTGATLAQTKAQLGLNAAMKANVVGLVIAAVAGLTVGIVALIKKIKEKNKISYEEEKQVNKNIKALKEETEARNELIKAQQDQINAGLSELDHISNLKNELDSLVDENGRVKKGYKDRVQFILGELNDALGTEISMTGDVINNYKKLQDEIDKVILKKKGQIILQAQEEAYTKAIQNQTEAVDLLRQYQEEAAKSSEALNVAQVLMQQVSEDGTKKEIKNAKKRYEAAVKENADKQKLYEDQKALVEGYYNDIATYEQNATLLASKNADDWQKVVDSVSASYEKNGEEIKLSLQEQILNEQQALEAKEKLRQKDIDNGIKAEESKYNTQVEASKKRLGQLADELKKQTSTVNENSPEVVKAWRSLATNSFDIFEEIVSKMPKDLKAKVLQMAGYVEKDGKLVEQKFSEMAYDSAGNIKEADPEFKEAGKGNVESTKKGMASKTKEVEKTAEFIAEQSANLLGGKDAEFKAAGKELGDAANSGLSSKEGSIEKTAENIGKDAAKKLNQKENAKTSGSNLIDGAKEGANSSANKKGGFLDTVASIAKSALKKLKNIWKEQSPSKETFGMAEYFVQGLTNGIKSKAKEFNAEVGSLAKNAMSTLNETLQMDNVKGSIHTAFDVNNGANTGNASNSGNKTQVINFYQTNNSPKSLSRLEIYKDTKKAIARLRGGVTNV